MSSERRLVSTIIPVYNRAEELRDAVASVLAQTWRPIEIILIDDGSTDGTDVACSELAAQHPELIQFHRQANSGAGVARQAGVAMARGEFIQFLDSDDLLFPEKFALQVAKLDAHPEAGICYGLTLSSQGGGPSVPTHGTETERRRLLPEVLWNRPWPTLSPLYRRDSCVRIGAWSSLRVLEDWDYDCRAGLAGISLCYVPEPLALVRRGRTDHAGLAWKESLDVLRDRGLAYERVMGYALQVGIARDAPEMKRHVRSLFWMARLLASKGIEPEAKRLFALARDNAVEGKFHYSVFAMTAALIGWRRTASLAGRLGEGR